MSGRVVVLRGDAAHLPLPDGSVDLIVTSPPYFQQRDYRDGGASLEGQLGKEETPRAYIAALLACTREWVRVLKPEGSLFVNLDDKYRPGGNGLMGLTSRYVIGCMDELGLIQRAEILWSKANGLPEKAKDRAHRTHEHLLHFTTQTRYFSSCDAIREPHAEWTLKAYRYERKGYNRRSNADRMDKGGFAKAPEANPLGKMPGSVWEITPQPLALPAWLDVDHFAPMPTEMARRCVLGWSPLGGVVLDPFGGVGTTALVAVAFGRTGISADLSHDYGRAAMWRVGDPGERARVLGLPKPVPVIDGQDSLFSLGEAS